MNILLQILFLNGFGLEVQESVRPYAYEFLTEYNDGKLNFKSNTFAVPLIKWFLFTLAVSKYVLFYCGVETIDCIEYCGVLYY